MADLMSPELDGLMNKLIRLHQANQQPQEPDSPPLEEQWNTAEKQATPVQTVTPVATNRPASQQGTSLVSENTPWGQTSPSPQALAQAQQNAAEYAKQITERNALANARARARWEYQSHLVPGDAANLANMFRAGADQNTANNLTGLGIQGRVQENALRQQQAMHAAGLSSNERVHVMDNQSAQERQAAMLAAMFNNAKMQAEEGRYLHDNPSADATLRLKAEMERHTTPSGDVAATLGETTKQNEFARSATVANYVREAANESYKVDPEVISAKRELENAQRVGNNGQVSKMTAFLENRRKLHEAKAAEEARSRFPGVAVNGIPEMPEAIPFEASPPSIAQASEFSDAETRQLERMRGHGQRIKEFIADSMANGEDWPEAKVVAALEEYGGRDAWNQYGADWSLFGVGSQTGGRGAHAGRISDRQALMNEIIGMRMKRNLDKMGPPRY